MYLTMNRFMVQRGCEAEFEAVWLGRDSKLAEVPGFRGFHLLRGPERDDHTLYATHTTWESEAAFRAWTQSEAFRAAHRGAGDRGHLYAGPPELEVFDSVQAAPAG